MTGAVSYKEAKQRAAALPPAERDAYISRVLAYRQEADRAGGPVQIIGLLLTFVGFGVLIWAGSVDGASRALYVVALAVFVIGAVVQHLAARRKRAWERAHPFKG